MSETISWSFKVQVTGGPSLNATDTIDVDAYDKIVATVKKKNGGAGKATIDIQPGDAAQILLITSTLYEDLTYEVDSSGSTEDLDGPLVLIGAGAVSLLNDTQNQIVFTNNNTSNDATVTVLVGRNAVS